MLQVTAPVQLRVWVSAHMVVDDQTWLNSALLQLSQHCPLCCKKFCLADFQSLVNWVLVGVLVVGILLTLMKCTSSRA